MSETCQRLCNKKHDVVVYGWRVHVRPTNVCTIVFRRNTASNPIQKRQWYRYIIIKLIDDMVCCKINKIGSFPLHFHEHCKFKVQSCDEPRRYSVRDWFFIQAFWIASSRDLLVYGWRVHVRPINLCSKLCASWNVTRRSGIVMDN